MKKKSRNKPNKPYFRLNQVLLFLFILFLPSQLGKHFFFPFSYLSGVRVDYLAPTLYLTDILVFVLFFVNIKSILKFFLQKKLLLILFLLFLNVLFSLSFPVSIYRYFKIIELLIIFAAFYKKKFSEKLLLFGFLITGIIELILSILQFINKGALQGLFYFLGERYFSLGTPGIAKASLNGVEFLRPYASFSHPNSLAGFYLLIYFFVLTSKKFREFSILKSFSLFVFSSLVFISFSKVAIFTYIVLNVIYSMLNVKKNCRICFVSRISVLLILGLLFLQTRGDPLTLGKRFELLGNAVTIVVSHPLLGVGLGNYLLAQSKFISKYPLFFNQPVHNIFLLFLAETGLFIGGFILFQLINLPVRQAGQLKQWLKKPVGFYLIAVIVMTGLFDHYWLTLQQNFLLLPLIFSLF